MCVFWHLILTLYLNPFPAFLVDVCLRMPVCWFFTHHVSSVFVCVYRDKVHPDVQALNSAQNIELDEVHSGVIQKPLAALEAWIIKRTCLDNNLRFVQHWSKQYKEKYVSSMKMIEVNEKTKKNNLLQKYKFMKTSLKKTLLRLQHKFQQRGCSKSPLV